LAHYELLKECGLTKDDLEKIVDSDRIQLRDNYKDFFGILDQNNIPLVIITSNGLGGDVIKMVFKRFDIIGDDIYLIANEII
jgi:2-hydroxy-3-keto-5-methylthiopentenyl-1-phosphate phosphatase